MPEKGQKRAKLTPKDSQGTYELSAIVNGKPSWTSLSKAIWYSQVDNDWEIGNLNDIGKNVGVIYTDGMLLTPNEKWQMELQTWKEVEGTRHK